MLQFLNTTFNDTVKVAEDAKFVECVFAALGANKKDTNTPGLKINGSAKADIDTCTFKNTGYNALSITTSGDVAVENCVFECGNVYNPIEGTVSTGSAVNKVLIKGNTFNGSCGNNFMSFYKMADGAEVNIENNRITGAMTNNNVVRLSNPDNVEATFNVKNLSYIYAGGEPDEYTGFLLCQDFTAKSGKPEDFSKYSVNLTDIMLDNVKIVEKPAVGSLFYVYQDGAGIITGTNDPTITLK